MLKRIVLFLTIAFGMAEDTPCVIDVCNDHISVLNTIMTKIVTTASDAILSKGIFTIALSGGSMIQMLKPLAEVDSIQWESWRIFYADERCVEANHPESTHGLYQKELFSKVPIPLTNIITIEDFEDPSSAANKYENRLRALVPDLSLDLVLLGMGPDGHTASLFPGHELVLYDGPCAVMPIFDSPKPPPSRITLTLSTINRARQVVFLVTGENKVPVLSEILAPLAAPSAASPLEATSAEEGRAPMTGADADPTSQRSWRCMPRLQYPCSLVKPRGSLDWVLEGAAARALSRVHVSTPAPRSHSHM